MKHTHTPTRFFVLAILLALVGCVLAGCGTDVKTTSFINIVKDPGDIDTLAGCLSNEPEIEGENINITLNKQCLIDFSLQDKTDPNLAASFAEIVANVENHMDKLLTFEAVVKKVHAPDRIELYTNTNLRFHIYAHGAPIYRLDEEGDQIPIQPNELYRFKCRIYEYKIHADWGNTWEAHAEFIVSTNKSIVFLPELVE